MPNLEIYYKDQIVNQVSIDSVNEAKNYAKNNSEPNDQKTFIYSTINKENRIENTIIIKRPHYG